MNISDYIKTGKNIKFHLSIGSSNLKFFTIKNKYKGLKQNKCRKRVSNKNKIKISCKK